MTDGFTDMIATATRFLGELARNNDRAWFDARKAVFKNQIEAPLKLLVDLFAEDLLRLTGVSHDGKVGRIYRDVRFSKDKSPFNTHVHAYWRPPGDGAPGWLLRIDATGVRLLTGLHDLTPAGVARYRLAVDRDGDTLQRAIDAARTDGADLIDFGETLLKRVPKPFDPGHPHGGLLRRKQIALGVPLDDHRLAPGLLPAMAGSVATLLPFWTWCEQAVMA